MPIARDQHDIAIDNDHHDEVRDVTPSLLSSFWTVQQGRRRRLKNSVSRTVVPYSVTFATQRIARQ